MTQKPTNELLLDKHVDFIVNYGKTHDKYVFIKLYIWSICS